MLLPMKHSLLRSSFLTGSSLLTIAALSSVLSSCGDEAVAETPVRDIPGVVLLDIGDDGNNEPLQDEQAPPGFDSYGFWYTYHDIDTCEETGIVVTNAGGFVNPAQGAQFTTTPYAAVAGMTAPPEVLPNAQDNTNGIRFSGGKHTYFGAGLGFKFARAYGTEDEASRDGVLNPGINISGAGYKGFRFWAYSALAQSWYVKIQDFYSTPQAGQCEPRGEAPGCVGPQHCEDAPLVSVEVGPAWRLYEVYFAAMADDPASPELEIGPLAREGWATLPENAPAAAPDKVYQLQFQTVDGKVDFDLWLDNVGFIE